MNLDDLIQRLERARPSRKIDAMIHRVVFPDDAGAPPRYTSSGIAALILFPDTSPRALCIAALKARVASAADRDAQGQQERDGG